MIVEKITILISTLILLSCGDRRSNSTSPEVKDKITNTDVVNISEVIETNIIQEDNKDEVITEENPVRLDFGQFIIEIGNLEIWDEGQVLNNIQKDTARVYLELGESIEGRTLSINQRGVGEIRIYQRFENSVTIMNEGPHCDLTEWKHYDSEWKELEINGGKFLTRRYSEKLWEKFIEIDIEELKLAVRNHCGEDWEELVKNVKSPLEYPCAVATNRIFLKVEYNNQSDNISKEEIVSFEIPMGC